MCVFLICVMCVCVCCVSFVLSGLLEVPKAHRPEAPALRARRINARDEPRGARGPSLPDGLARRARARPERRRPPRRGAPLPG